VHFKEKMGLYSWRNWPSEFRDPYSEGVQEWAEKNREQVEYYQYLAWIGEEGFTEARKALDRNGIGLYLDLPVGVSPSGFETWYYQGLFANGISIGAPPDAFNPRGQKWGLPPVIPQVLEATDFENFRQTIGFSMAGAQILRIDHVMGLRRLFWIPEGMLPSKGVYVRYPMEELFSIIALESWRNRCTVVGEDLGTVPDEVRKAMEEKHMLSSSVFIFEKGENGFKHPGQYKRFSVSSLTTHDLPTLRGFWKGFDIKKRKECGLFQDENSILSFEIEREKDKEQILELLISLDLLPGLGSKELLLKEYSEDLSIAVHRFLLLTNSMITVIQPEDLIGELEQKNLPGTFNEYPNWRKRFPYTIDELIKNRVFTNIFKQITNKKYDFLPEHFKESQDEAKQ
jgi:(1->4)-alpha-D-glucan 1-alpha-D-glucosylmutase